MKQERECTTPDTCMTCHVCQSQEHQTKDHKATSSELAQRFRVALEQIGVWTQELQDEAQARDFGLAQWRGCVAIATAALAGTGPDYPALEEQLLAAQSEVRRLRVVVAGLSADASAGHPERSGGHPSGHGPACPGVARWLLLAALEFTDHQTVNGRPCSGRPCLCGCDEVDAMIASFLNG